MIYEVIRNRYHYKLYRKIREQVKIKEDARSQQSLVAQSLPSYKIGN